MNRQAVLKTELFISGLKERYKENESIFKELYGEYISGATSYKFRIAEGKLSFNKEIKKGGFSELTDELIEKANLYDGLRLYYCDRISTIEIVAENGRVTSKTYNEEKSAPTDTADGQGEHLISPKNAERLLKTLDFVTEEGKLKNTHIRKFNQAENFLRLLTPYIEELPQNKTLYIYDLACGKSYLSFFINYYMCEVLKRKCFIYGIDINKNVTDASEKLAQKAGYKNMKFICGDILSLVPENKPDIAVSLHACDLATDYAIACAVNNNAKVVAFVPCCHKELKDDIIKNSDDKLSFITEHKILGKRFADIFTDAYRVKILEENGYDMTLTEFVSPLDTPKNLIMLGKKKESFKKEDKTDKIERAFGISPTLKKLIF